MKRFIRWQGFMFFVIVVLFFGAFWLFFADGIVKGIIQKYGTRAVGARVELGAPARALCPRGLHPTRLRVTDPDSPMKNAVEIDRISLSLEPLNLLRRKVIVREMTLDGIQLGTPRKSSGAIKGKSRPGKAEEDMGKGKAGGAVKGPCGGLSIPSFQIPDVKKILQTEQLQSLELVESLQKDIEGAQTKWKDALTKLPGKEKFDGYRRKIDELKSAKKGGIGGILGSASELTTLKEDIQRDLDQIKSARGEFTRETASLKDRLAEAKSSPLKDVARLKQKYALSPAGLQHLSKALLGSRLCELVQKAGAWYEKLKPVIERAGKREKGHEVVKPLRGKGVNVRFKEYEPLPDFLVREAKARVILKAGEIAGLVRDITPDQDVLGRPLKYAFEGDKLKGLRSFDLRGVLNHVSPAQPRDTASLVVKGYKVEDMALSGGSAFPLILNEALADLKLDAMLQGKDIKADIVSGFDSVKLSGGAVKETSPVMAALLSSLSDISRFQVNANIAGTLSDYTIDLNSDLDRVFAEAAGKAVAKQAGEFEKKLKDGVLARVEGPLNATGKDMGGLNGIGQELTERLNLGEGLFGNLKGLTGKGGLKLPF
jgi:uncharacterized protein (TIGR03545 family)